MKKLLSNKKLLLWLGIGAAALVAAVAVVLVLLGALAPKAPADNYQLYWNVDGEYYTQTSADGLSDREADSDGVFHLRFASEAGIEEFTTTDKKLINLIDTLFVVALEVNENNEILQVQDPSMLGYTIYRGLYVRTISAGTITCNTSVVLNGMPVRVRISDALQVLDVRSDAETIGARMEADDLNALDYVYTCATEDQVFTHVFLAGRSPKSSIYWRASQSYNSTKKETTRVPDENGVYTVDFFSDGNYVELKCKDKDIVTTIDRANRFICHFALEFDEEGYIIKTKMSSLGIKGAVGCSNYVVTAYEDGILTATAMSGSEAGTEYSVEIDDSCIVYDVSKTAMSEGRQGKPVDSLLVGDRIVLWTDVDGYPVVAYVTLRTTDVSPYFNMQRKWSSYYKKTTRVADAQGYYYVELLKAGDSESKIYKTKDKALVDLIDSRGDRTVGIRAEGDLLTTVYEAECIFGYTNQGPRYVTMASGAMYSAMTYKNQNDVINGVYDISCPVYDVSGAGPLGAKTDLRVGDLIIIHRGASLETKLIYVIRREMGVDYAYYNLERMYDTEKKTTTREPVDGYYVFKMANKGKIVTVKTKSKELATQMDACTPPAMGLILKNDIVQYVFDPVNISGAVRVAYYSTVDKVENDGTVSATTSTGITSTFRPSKDCVYYNCSQLYKTNRGEQVSGVKPGDLITGYLDRNGEAKVVYILSRETSDIAWNTQRKYNSTTKETTREAEDGWYVYQLLIGNTVKTLRTKDRDLANRIDSYDGAFGVHLDKDVILGAMGVGLVKNVAGSGVNGWDVVKQNGSKITLRYTKPGSEKYTGQEQEATLAKNLKVYDISPTAKVYGQEVKLQLGDRIRTYVDDDGKVLYAYVLNHVTRTDGGESYCAHCDQIVHWEPWTGASFAQADRHYYMNSDVEKTVVLNTTTTAAQSTSAAAAAAKAKVEPYEIVLDLNGKTMKVNGSRCFTVNDGQTLTIMDCTGDGVLTSGGPVNGGTFSVQKGGTLNIQSGIIKGVVDDGYKGSVIYVVAGGTVNISGTAVVDGSGMTLGKGNGGAIYSNGTVNILGGEVKGGSVGSGGSVSVQGGALNISGGKVYGGQAKNYGDDIFVNNEAAVVTVSGGEVAGQFWIDKAKTVTISGAPKLGNLKPSPSVKLTLGKITEGADVAVAATDAFTLLSENADSYAKYFRTVDSKKQVLAMENALWVTVAGAKYTHCDHCDQTVYWEPYNGSIAAENRHYYLNKDIVKEPEPESEVPETTVAETTVPETTVETTQPEATEPAPEPVLPDPYETVLDLNGKSIKRTNGSRCFVVNKCQTMTVMDSVGGGNFYSGGVAKENGIVGAEINGGVFSVQDKGVLNLTAGTFKGIVSSKNKGSVIYVVEGGTVNISGTAVVDGSEVKAGEGACGTIYSSGTVNILGGEVKGGSVGSGGSVYVNAGDLNISGGKISGGQAANYGDDIFVSNEEAVVTVSGGEVTGEFRIDKAKTVTISGALKLGNLKLSPAVKLTLGNMIDGADVAVAAADAFTQLSENADSYAKYFRTVDSKKQVLPMENVLWVTVAGAKYTHCDHCDQTVYWEPYNGSIVAENMHYYLNKDIVKEPEPESEVPETTVAETTVTETTVTETTVEETTQPETTEPAPEPVLPDPYETVLDLNGKSIKRTNGSRCFVVNKCQTMTVMDSVGGGNFYSGGVAKENGIVGAEINGGVFSVQDKGVLNLTAGTFKGIVSSKNKGSVIYVVEGGTVNISGTAVVDGSEVKAGEGACGTIYSSGTVNILGGEVKGGSVGSGGSVYVNAGDLNISGGKISGGQAANYGDDIFVSNEEAVVTVSGGEVAGEFKISKAKTATLSGAPSLKDLNLTAGVKLTIGDLSTDVRIDLKATGAFTEKFENAEAYLEVFRTSDDSQKVIVSDGVLCMEEFSECSHCNSKVVWRAWKATYTESGHYYLNAKVSRSLHYAPVAEDIIIDLRGQTWETGSSKRAMLINDGITVTIMDTVGTGEIIAGAEEDGGVFSIKNGGTLNFIGGTAKVSATKNTVKGSVAYIAAGGTLNLSGGTLDASGVTIGKGACGAVYSSGTVNISGGEVKGGSVGSGGSVYINAGELTISGGKISGGQAANYGDDIFVSNADSEVVISGGEVSGQFQINAAKSVTLSGAPVLGNVKPVSAIRMVLGELSEDARITVAAIGEFTVANEKAKDYLDAGCFIASSNKDSVQVTADGILYIPYCPHCNKTMGNITWTAWDATTAKSTNGHYYLTDEVKTSVQFVPTATDVVIDLRGNNYTVTASNVRAFLVNSGVRLSIIDTVGNGTISGKRTTKGSAFCVQGGGVLDLYGGTAVAGYAATSGSVAYVEVNGTMNLGGKAVLDGSAVTTGSGTCGTIYNLGALNISGGEVKGASAGSGGSIYMTDGSLNISGGKVHGGQAKNYGDDIFVNGASCEITISGGEVSGQFHIDNAKTTTISGAPVLGNVKLASAVMLTLGELDQNARIAVAKEGAFTVANENAKSYLDAGCFESLVTGKTIREEDGVLIID